MKRIIKERGAGKTYDLVKLSAEKQIPILCMGNYDVLDVAKELNVKIPEPISIWEYKRGFHKGRRIDDILVDEADFILQELLNIPIYALTITKPKEISKKEIANIIGVNVDDFIIVE